MFVGVDVVIDARRLHLLAIVARMRNALAVRASVSIGRIAAGRGPVAVERASENRERSSGGVAVQRKKLLVERHQLGRGLIRRSGDGIHAAARQLLQHVALKRRRRHGGGGHDRQRNPNPFGVEEEKQLVVEDRSAQAAAEVIHRGARLMISGRGVGKEIGRVEFRSVPQLIQISMKLIGPDLVT